MGARAKTRGQTATRAGAALVLASTLACAPLRGQPADPEPGAPAGESDEERTGSQVFAERETFEGPQPEVEIDARQLGPFNASKYQGMVIGVAHGPSRGVEAQELADDIAALGLHIDDVWSVDASSWGDPGDPPCVDRIAFFTPRSEDFAYHLRAQIGPGLDVEPDETSAHYDVIVQLCPRGMTGPRAGW